MAKFKPRRTLLTVQWGGYAATEPQTRSAGQKEVIYFNIAWNNINADGDEKTDWIRVQCWSGNPLFDIISQYVKKGSCLLVTGRLRIEYYTNKDGEEKKGFIIDLENLQLLGNDKNQRGDAADTHDAEEDIEGQDAYTPVRGKPAGAAHSQATNRQVAKKRNPDDTPF